MGSRVLALDNILSATFFFVGKWSPGLKHNQSRDLLRFLLCRLYDQGRGDLMQSQLTLAQTTLARKLGLSRQWVGILLERLQAAGWLEYYAPRLQNGMHGSTIFRAGGQLKRVLMKLMKVRPGKTPRKSAAQPRWHFSPSQREKELKKILEREKQPPSPETLHRFPLLQAWLTRGEARSQTSGHT
jgi:DNA-binding Lrp family transcriptional regulator